MEEEREVCGIVMPISSIDGCDESHWAEVQDILVDAIEDAGFIANLVSHADEVGIIHKRIIQNLYENPIVVCDVSGKNPNVMFELGLRLAFDKPTIIVKDDKTSYSFDTSAIEHLEYPRGLRFSSVVEFKSRLTEKIKKTYERASNDSSYTTFLKHFGEFKVAKIDKKEVSGQEFILDELKSIRSTMRRLERLQPREILNPKFNRQKDIDICLSRFAPDKERTDELVLKLISLPGVEDVEVIELREGHAHLTANISADSKLTPSEVSNLLGISRRKSGGARKEG
ncbi:hypothetical protein ACSEU1_12875 [Pseudomonas aeruginosa]